uniref:ABC transmembrane type-1 domain-containing protein n=1 Tax=Pseudictyota dubia TaxID=2749911 RepID=A0A7R9VUS5_9STRA
MSEALSGIASIRANNAMEFYKGKFREAHDAHSRAFFAFLGSSRWVGFRMDSLMFLLLALASYLAVLFHEQGWFSIDPAVLGLALTMLLQLAGTFQWAVRQSAEVVNQMVSVERISDFCHLPSEAVLASDKDSELAAWPTSGSINVSHLSIRYRESLPLSLRNVSIRIQSGHRVGVVGRTGSGE